MNHTPLRVLLSGNLAPWTATVRSGLTGEVTLTDNEVRDLCCAIELDRVQRGDVTALLTRRRMSRKPLEWRQLMDGANGLTRGDSVGAQTVGELLARVGVEVLRVDLVDTPEQALKRWRNG